MKKALLFVTLFHSFAFGQQVITGKVRGLGPVSCNVYLHLPKSPKPNMPVILMQVGSGVYSTAKLVGVHPVPATLLANNLASVVTINKPGIPDDLETQKFDERQFLLHTMRDLSECARQALNGVMSQPLFKKSRIILIGHSEGTEVLTRTLENLRNYGSTYLDQIRMVVLSGTPVDDIRDILRFQFDDNWLRAFWKTYSARNEANLAEITGNGLLYWDDVLTTEPLETTLLRLGSTGLHTPFFIFHGIRDKHTPAKSVQRFEARNKSLSSAGRPSLNLTVRYFNAEHTLNEPALLEMLELVRRAL